MTQRSPKTTSKQSTVKPVAQQELPQPTEGPHELECRVQRSLQAVPGLRFTRLVVHQCEQGLCLEGTLEANDSDVDLCELVKRMTSIPVINRVVSLASGSVD